MNKNQYNLFTCKHCHQSYMRKGRPSTAFEEFISLAVPLLLAGLTVVLTLYFK